MQEIFTLLGRAYQENDFTIIFGHEYGSYYLKLRSLSRAEILRRLATHLDLDVENIGARELFQHLFCQNIDEGVVDEFIRLIYEEERAERIAVEEDLYTQMYRLQAFNWGGFYQNAVEQTIVNNYIKKIRNFDALNEAIDGDITPRLRNYILCSWYNHWTSILIEDMFRDHEDILPAVGLVKKVDFFWHNFPFDLKVTYFPDGFMKLKRQELGLRPELTVLKQFARGNGIPYDRGATDNEIFEELLARIEESPSDAAREFIVGFHETRRQIIDETIQNSRDLIIWFYENQGTRRFDAANRFFLVLVDRRNLEESWKLKRNRDLLSDGIDDYLDGNRNIDFNNLQVEFVWEGNVFHCHATCLFLIRE